MMRTLFILLVVAALGWSGYWWVGATANRAAMEGWLAERQGRGWAAEAGSLTVSGYPNRFDTTIEDLSLADPGGAWSWHAPWFQILALSYRPNHVIAVWPPAQTLEAMGERIDLTSARLRGSLRVAPSPSLALRQLVLEAEGVSARADSGWSVSLGEGRIGLRESAAADGRANTYDLGIVALTVRLPERLHARLSPPGLLPDTVARVEARLAPAFDVPLDRHAMDAGGPRLEALGVEDAQMVWGDVEIRVSGALQADEFGLAEGSLRISALNWQDLLAAARHAGFLAGDSAERLRRAMLLLARAGGDEKRLQVIVSFADGVARIGPVELGPAPRLN